MPITYTTTATCDSCRHAETSTDLHSTGWTVTHIEVRRGGSAYDRRADLVLCGTCTVDTTTVLARLLAGWPTTKE